MKKSSLMKKGPGVEETEQGGLAENLEKRSGQGTIYRCLTLKLVSETWACRTEKADVTTPITRR